MQLNVLGDVDARYNHVGVISKWMDQTKGVRYNHTGTRRGEYWALGSTVQILYYPCNHVIGKEEEER